MTPVEGDTRAREKYNMALAKAKGEKYREALHLLEESLELNFAFHEAHNLLGKVYLQLGKIRRAKKSWQKALYLDPSNNTARICLDALDRNRFHWWLALISMTVLVLIFFEVIFFMTLNRKVDLHATILREEKEKITMPIMENLNKRFDSLESAVLKLRNDLSRKEPRIEVIRKQVTVTKDPIEDRYKKSVYLFLDRRYEESRQSLMMLPMQEVKQSLKDNVVFWIGLCYYKQGRYPEALKQFEEVMELYPKGNKVPDAKKYRTRCLKKMNTENQAKTRL